jgi:hypothetical protein
MTMAVFWVVAPCSLVDVYRRFRGVYCLHHQGDYSTQQPRRKPSLRDELHVKFGHVLSWLYMRITVKNNSWDLYH